MLVEHMILSHHGKYEFGSPKLPMTPEAMLLSAMGRPGSEVRGDAAGVSGGGKCGQEGGRRRRIGCGVWTGILFDSRRWLGAEDGRDEGAVPAGEALDRETSGGLKIPEQGGVDGDGQA